MLLPNRTAYSRTFLIAFPLFSLSHPLHSSLLVDGHSSFCMLLSDSGMTRSPLACHSPSDGRNVLLQGVGLSGILLFVSVTELLPFAKFSRHAKAQTSLALVIWLNENILIPSSSLMTFPGEASTLTFSVAKLVQAVFCKYQCLIP